MGVSAIKADFPCRLCAGRNLYLYHVMGNDGRYRYFRCADCTLVNYDLSTGLTQAHFEVPDKDPLDDRDPWNLDKDASFRFLQRYVSPPGTLLDIGCGNGRLMYVAQNAGWTVRGLELSSVMAELVTERIGANVMVADFLQTDPREISVDGFDVISMRHILEHLPDCLLAMKKLRQLLKPQGYVLLEFPNVESVSKKIKRLLVNAGLRKPKFPESVEIGHANEFCRSSFEFLLARTGFKLVRWETYSKRPLTNFFYNHIHYGSNARALIEASET